MHIKRDKTTRTRTIYNYYIHVRVCKLILVINSASNLPLKFYWSSVVNWSKGEAVSNKAITWGVA